MKEESRRKIAQEAARLLYYNFAGEYKQAKEKASRRLNLNGWPSNLEVALALNKIANEVEGGNREKLIIHLRLSWEMFKWHVWVINWRRVLR